MARLTYDITLSGDSQSGGFDMIPPISDEHYEAIMQEPRLSLSDDFYLERGHKKDDFWLGREPDNGSGYGVYYERASGFARVVQEVLRGQGVIVTLTKDYLFEAALARKLRQAQANNQRLQQP